MKHVASIALAISFLVGSAPPLPAQPSKEYTDAYRARIQKINARMLRKQIEADCKAKAKKTYSAIHFQKRRTFVEDCTARARLRGLHSSL